MSAWLDTHDGLLSLSIQLRKQAEQAPSKEGRENYLSSAEWYFEKAMDALHWADVERERELAATRTEEAESIGGYL
jgi:hypothetical protein